MAKTKKNNQQQDFRRSLRFQSLKKKLNELTLLCDVDAFLLCSDQHGTGNGVLRSSYSWPEDQRSFLSLINKYNNYSKDENKKKRKRKRKRNDGINIDFGFDMTGFQSSMEGLGSDEVQGMLHRIEWKKRKLSAMLHSLKQKNQIVNEEKSSDQTSRISDEEYCENHDSILMMNEGSDMWSGLLQSEFIQTGACCRLVKEEIMNQGKEGSDMWSSLLQSEFVQTGACRLVKEEEAMNQRKEGFDMWSDLLQSEFVRTEEYGLFEEEAMNQGKEGSDMWSGFLESVVLKNGAYGFF